MASGRKKCVCQICTCGKHICPHRKKSTFVLKEIQNGENGHQEEIKRAPTRKITNKGRGRPESLESWSQKQIPKTLSMKPSDNLKLEGPQDLTTLHQQDFTKKYTDDLRTYDISTRTSTKRQDSWDKKQVPKTLPIKNPDNLKASGYQDFKTTHGVSYTDITPVDYLLKHEKENEGIEDGKVRKLKRPRPLTSLKSEGNFQTESLYQKDFTPRPVDRSPKHRPTSHLKSEGQFQTESLYQKDFTPRPVEFSPRHRPSSNLKPEGQMYFDTTSLDYKEVKDIIPKRPRPQSQIRIPHVPLMADSTVATDFPKWNVNKPPRWKPMDNLQHIGESESIDEHELLEQIKNENILANDNGWKPRSPLVGSPDSEPDIRTSDVVEDNNKPILPDAEINGNVTEENQETSDEPEHEIEPQIPESITPPDESADDHIGLENGVEHNEEAIDGQELEAIRKETEENIGEQIFDEATDESQYLTWDQVRPEPIRPQSNLRQHGQMQFSTTNRSEFINRPLEKVRGFRPKTTTKITGDMQIETTNQAMFGNVDSERAIPIRPKSNLHVEIGAFNDETTSAREFQPWHVEKQQPYIHRSTLAQEGDMEFSTTHHREFNAKDYEKVNAIRPRSNTKLYSVNGEFDGRTTNQMMHPKFEGEKVQTFRPHSNLKPHSGAFIHETTNKREYQEWGFDRMSPYRPRTNMKQEGDMDFTTMNQIQFQGKPGEMVYPTRITRGDRTHGARPPTNLKMEGDFTKESLSKSEYKQWELGRPDTMKPKSSVRQEGDIDFTTITQSQFDKKEIEKVGGMRPPTSTKITGEFHGTTTSQEMSKYVSSNDHKLYLSETRRRNEMRPHSAELVSGQDMTDSARRLAYHTPQYDRAHRIRYRDHIREMNAPFNDETTSRREFIYRPIDRAEPIRPKPSLSPEGGFNFVTSNQMDFDAKETPVLTAIRPKTMTKPHEGEFDGTTTNQLTYRAVAGETVKPIRPQNNLHLEKGGFYDITTMKDEFQACHTDRPVPIIYNSTLKQEGDMQFETTSRTEFSEKTTEHPIAIRPKTTTRIEGKLDATTTNQIMYPNYKFERVQPIKQKDNLSLEGGKFNDETTSKREFKQWVKAPIKDKKVIPLRAAGIPSQRRAMITTPDVLIKAIEPSETALEETTGTAAIEETTIDQETPPQVEIDIEPEVKSPDRLIVPEPEITSPKHVAQTEETPENIQEASVLKSPSQERKLMGRLETEPILTENQNYVSRRVVRAPKRFKPHDNLRFEDVPFDGNTTTRSEFVKWQTGRSSSKKRSPLLKQEGDMRFTTTSNDYSMKELHDAETRVKIRTRKPPENLRHSGVMDFSTTNQSVYVGSSMPKTRNLRPKSTLKLGSDDSKPRQPSDLTTAGASYKGFVVERTRVSRPLTSQKVGEGQLEMKSTTQSVFTGPKHKMEKTQAFKPDSSKAITGPEEFQGNTTYRCSFEAMKPTRNCPALELENDSKFQFKEEVNGHRFYLPLVLG